MTKPASRLQVSTTWVDELTRRMEQHHQKYKFGHNEKIVLGLFYDNRLKVRRRLVPKFAFYAQACADIQPSDWTSAMLATDQALLNLTDLKLLQKASAQATGSVLKLLAGEMSGCYELTADGFERLQQMHPPIALRLKAWIAVLPPWLVVLGSVAGAIGAIWKITELVLSLF